MHKNVKNLEKRSGEILTREDIRAILYPELGSEASDTRLSQHIYALKGSGMIIPLKNSLYYIHTDDTPCTQERIILEHYWQIVKKIVREYSLDAVILGGEKALEFHMRDTSPPELLILYTHAFASRIRLSSGHSIHFRTLKTGKKTLQKNAFRILRSESVRGEIDGEKYMILSLEAALLDTLTIHSHTDGITDSLVLRFLKRHGHELSREKLGMLTTFRYIRAMNRLRELTKRSGYESLYRMTLDIIKREGGGCFVHCADR